MRTESECAQDWTEAEQALEKAFAKPPKHEVVGGYHTLGQALENCQKFDAAIAAYERGQTLQSWHAQYPSDIARVRVRQQQLTQALPIYRQFHQSESETLSTQEIDALAYNDLGENLVWVGELERAIATFDYAPRLTPKNAALWNNLGQAQVKVQKIDLALQSFRQAIQLKESALTPKQLDARAYLQVGHVLTMTKNAS